MEQTQSPQSTTVATPTRSPFRYVKKQENNLDEFIKEVERYILVQMYNGTQAVYHLMLSHMKMFRLVKNDKE